MRTNRHYDDDDDDDDDGNDDVCAVSYTHLDVYKRQVTRRRTNL